MPHKITVDADLRSLIPAYLENRNAELSKLAELLLDGNLDAIRTTGHQLAGSGGGYGFARISEIGKAMESAALAGSKEEVKELISELAGYLADLELVYE